MIKYHTDIVQGDDTWKAVRCGVLTASEMKHIISPVKLEPVKNPAHLYELLAQRITGYVESAYISDDMLRGMTDEVDAKLLYATHYGEVQDVGFITNDKWGFTLGYSPDALVGDDGLIECKSRRQKYQVESLISGTMPDDFRIQVQTGLLVSERKWCDFVTYCAGIEMMTVRVEPDAEVQERIIAAAEAFEARLDEKMKDYLCRRGRLIPTERKAINEGEIQL